MKLLSKYYRTNITATLIVVLLSSIGYYFLVHYVLIEQLDNTLKVEEEEVLDYVNKNGKLPEPSTYKDQLVIFRPAGDQVAQRNFSTIDFYDKEEQEHNPTRQLVFPIRVNEKMYNGYVLKSQKETEDLVQLILLITLVIVVLLLLILFLVNRFVLRRLWKPFDLTLSQLKQFDLTGKNKLKLEDTRIDEFKELNQAVSIMATHVSREYDALKLFTDNASHEMQTPLAIINSKLDLLIQGDNINEQQMEQLQGIYNALDRLSKMNQSLLLLAKMDNSQFKETSSVSLDSLIKEKFIQFDESIVNRHLVVSTDIDPLDIVSNKYMLDILLTNLLSNAIRHNIEQGHILVTLKNKQLVFSNTSNLTALDTQKIFQRFYRHEDTRQEGNGLGLSIVKRLCDDLGYSLEYLFRDNMHQFHIHFDQRLP